MSAARCTSCEVESCSAKRCGSIAVAYGRDVPVAIPRARQGMIHCIHLMLVLAHVCVLVCLFVCFSELVFACYEALWIRCCCAPLKHTAVMSRARQDTHYTLYSCVCECICVFVCVFVCLCVCVLVWAKRCSSVTDECYFPEISSKSLPGCNSLTSFVPVLARWAATHRKNFRNFTQKSSMQNCVGV